MVGKLKDESTDEFLQFATINYNGKYTFSDNEGTFELECKNPHLTIKITYLGYKPLIIDTILKNSSVDLGILRLEKDLNALKEVVITSGKYLKAIEESTVSIENINKGFLSNNQIVNFGNLLEKIPGVNFIDDQVSIRGGSGFSYGAGSRTMVLIDNMPALQFDIAVPNWENIPTEIIEKVEVVKGAGSSLYGSAAMNGVINILPIYAKKDLQAKINVFHGLYDTPADTSKKWWTTPPSKTGISGVVSKKIKKLDIVGAFYYQNAKSYKKDCFNNIGRVTINTKYHLNNRINFGINTNINSQQKYTFFYWKNQNSGAYIGDSVAYSALDKKLLIVDPFFNYQSRTGWKHVFKSRIYLASNRISLNEYDISKSFYGKYQIQKIFLKQKIILTGGIIRTNNYTDAKLYADTSFTATNTSIYTQVEKKFWEQLTVNAGARYEIYTIEGPDSIMNINIKDKYKTIKKPIFRLGLNYRILKNTNIRASIGQGFRYPTIAEKFTLAEEGDLKFLPNPDLVPESGYTAEIGLRQTIKMHRIHGYADLSFFQSEYNNMIELELRYKKFPFFTMVNLANTIIKGIEFSGGLNGKIANLEYDLSGGYMYINPKYKDFNVEVKKNLSVDYNILKYRYKHSLKYDFGINYNGFILGIGYNYNSFMEAIDKVFESTILFKGVKQYRESHKHGTEIYRLRLGYNYKNIQLKMNVDNLFNVEYSVRPGIMEAPRSFVLSLGYNLN